MSRVKNQYSIEDIEHLLFASDTALIKGLMRIYSHQTLFEQHDKDVKQNNGRGFRVCDARILTSMAQFYESYKYLTPKQLAIVKRKMPKYVRQLTNYANGKMNIK